MGNNYIGVASYLAGLKQQAKVRQLQQEQNAKLELAKLRQSRPTKKSNNERLDDLSDKLEQVAELIDDLQDKKDKRTISDAELRRIVAQCRNSIAKGEGLASIRYHLVVLCNYLEGKSYKVE